MTPSTTFCTILARNYLARALSLAESVQVHHPGSTLVVLLIDVADDADLPSFPGSPNVRPCSTSVLGLSERAVLDLAAGYDLVEFATAIKPLLLRELLDETDHVVYLDPDTWVASPLVELDAALPASEGGIVLTPHFLEPLPEGAPVTDGHQLTVGVYNLGFCAVDQRARPFLDWWWGRLEVECLSDILSGLFVDQKWVDLGSTLFAAAALRHYGYNNSGLNQHERPLERDAEGYYISTNGDRLRLYHFHAFDPMDPGLLTRLFESDTAHLRTGPSALEQLCNEYAAAMLRHRESLPAAPPYVYDADTRGRRLARNTRRAFRRHVQAGERDLPSPFVPADAAAFDRWRRSVRREVAKDVLGDAAKAVRCIAPDEVSRFQRRFPRLAARMQHRLVDGTGIWG